MELHSQGQKNLSLCCHPTGFPFLNAIYRKGREPCHTREFCLAYHFGLADFLDVIFVHTLRPLQEGRVSATNYNIRSPLVRSTKLVVIIINYGGLGALGKQDLCHEGAPVNR